MILGLDVSHFQAVNFAAARSAGRDFVVLKATEGTSYTDPTFAASRKAAHAAGLVVGAYHFARAGNAAAEAAWFLKTVGALQPGEFLVLDWEVPAPAGGAPAWCKAWLDAVAKATGVNPLIYMNSSAVAGSNWSAVAPTYGLWLAKYDGAPAAQNAVPYWGVCQMKQYSDAGSVLGVAGTCDVDSFFGTRDQLLAYGKQSSNGVVDMTPDEHNMLARIFTELTQQIPSRAYPSAPGSDTMAGYAVNADGFGWRMENKVIPAVVEQVQALATQVGQVAAPEIDEAKLAAALLADPASVDRLGAAIAAHLKLTSG